MRISSEQIQNEAVTLTEALKRLKDAPKEQLYVVLQRLGKEGYLIPMTFASLLVGSQSQGKLYDNPEGGEFGRIRVTAGGAVTGVTGAFVDVPAGERWRVVAIDAKFLMDSTIIARDVGLFANNAGGLPGMIAGLRILETSTVQFTADQQGQIAMATNSYHFTNDNGTVAIVADENPLPKVFNATSRIGIFDTNLQAGDQSSLQVFYQRVD